MPSGYTQTNYINFGVEFSPAITRVAKNSSDIPDPNVKINSMHCCVYPAGYKMGLRGELFFKKQLSLKFKISLELYNIAYHFTHKSGLLSSAGRVVLHSYGVGGNYKFYQDSSVSFFLGVLPKISLNNYRGNPGGVGPQYHVYTRYHDKSIFGIETSLSARKKLWKHVIFEYGLFYGIHFKKIMTTVIERKAKNKTYKSYLVSKGEMIGLILRLSFPWQAPKPGSIMHKGDK